MLSSISKADFFLRPLLVSKFPRLATRIYSCGRAWFIRQLIDARPQPIDVPTDLSASCWGITFRSRVFNAAGMFKTGEGYEVCQLQGAGAFLAGTSTSTCRLGNVKHGIKHPFVPYAKSHAASNFMGLPNPGDKAVVQLISQVRKVAGCPLGISLAADPALPENEKLEKLISGLLAFQDTQVDFIELNESCPNTGELTQSAGLAQRLELVAQKFLKQRKRGLPVIVKFSCDTPLEAVRNLVEVVVRSGFEGINFGNTSTQYSHLLNRIEESERPTFSDFTQNFGGGVSGLPLKTMSLSLIESAAQALRAIKPQQEFHLIRTGGVENAKDVKASMDAGASLVQWFTGYFEQFSKQGHSLYRELYRDLCRKSNE